MPTKPKQFYTYYQRKTAHTSEQCFLGPALKTKTKAIFTGDPVIRCNNLFTNKCFISWRDYTIMVLIVGGQMLKFSSM